MNIPISNSIPWSVKIWTLNKDSVSMTDIFNDTGGGIGCRNNDSAWDVRVTSIMEIMDIK